MSFICISLALLLFIENNYYYSMRQLCSVLAKHAIVFTGVRPCVCVCVCVRRITKNC